MRELDVAMTVIRQQDRYYLQLRNGNKQNGGIGLMGFFGGQIEPAESPEQAARRELFEETILIDSDLSDFRYLGQVQVESDHNQETVKVRLWVYETTVAADRVITATEGDLASLTYQEAIANPERLTTGTAACFKQLIKES